MVQNKLEIAESIKTVSMFASVYVCNKKICKIMCSWALNFATHKNVNNYMSTTQSHTLTSVNVLKGWLNYA